MKFTNFTLTLASLASLAFARKILANNVVRNLNKASAFLSITRDPFYEHYPSNPRYGVSGFTIKNHITHNWFKGDESVSECFLVWVFYKTVFIRVLKRIFHSVFIIFCAFLIIKYFVFSEFNLFIKIPGSLFFILILLLYYTLVASTPIRNFRNSVRSFDDGLFSKTYRDSFLQKLHPRMPANLYETSEIIKLYSIDNPNIVEALESLHPSWFGSNTELVKCAKTLVR